MNFITPIDFEMLKFKNPAIWLAKSIFVFNSRTTFFFDMQFQQNDKGNYGQWFKPKKPTHPWAFFLFAKSKQSYFRGVFWHYPQKSGSIRSVRKILRDAFEKMHLPTIILTYWQWLNHRTHWQRSKKFLTWASCWEVIVF